MMMTAKSYVNRVLILFAHPALQKSRVNIRMIEYVKDLGGVTFHDLYEAYPDFHVRVPYEQELLLRHDIVIFHHPVFWFSMPALLKEWMDLVLEHGWAYGKGGKALRGKKLLSVISTGGRESLYQQDGYNKHAIGEFLLPIRQMAFVCGMQYLSPFVVHGTHMISEDEIALQGECYRAVVTALRDDTVDLVAACSLSRINLDMDRIFRNEGR